MRDDTGNKGTIDIHFLNKPNAADSPLEDSPQQPCSAPTRYKLGERRAQGIANFRWPYMQYELQREQEAPDGQKEIRKGSYEGISFVKDGTMFQINRLSLSQPARPRSEQDETPRQKSQPIKFRVGGEVQFGCPCTNGADQGIMKDFVFEAVKGGRLLLYTNTTAAHGHRRLEIQVFINGKETPMTCDNKSSSGVLWVDLSEEKPTIIVSTYTLRDLSSDSITKIDPYPMIPMVAASEIEDYLGISNTSLEMTDKLWLASLSRQFNEIETIEICAVARQVEQILGVSSVPTSVTQPGPNSKFKVNTSDFERQPGIALVRNIISSQYVSLESTL